MKKRKPFLSGLALLAIWAAYFRAEGGVRLAPPPVKRCRRQTDIALNRRAVHPFGVSIHKRHIDAIIMPQLQPRIALLAIHGVCGIGVEIIGRIHYIKVAIREPDSLRGPL